MSQGQSWAVLTKRPSTPSWNRIVEIIGGIAIAVGAYLPWIQRNPSVVADSSAPIMLPEWVHIVHLAIMGTAVIILVPLAFTKWTWLRSLFVALAGAGVAYFCSAYTVFMGEMHAIFSGEVHNGYFVPDIGWYICLVGGIVLCIAGVIRIGTALMNRE